MKFILETTKSGARLGSLVSADSSHQFRTPILLMTTKAGSIPYLSGEVFEYITKETQLLQISLATTYHMEEGLKHFKNSLSKFIGYENYPIFVTLKDPCELCPTGYNEKDTVPLWTRRGKVAITPEKYMELMELIKPDIYQSLCDSDTSSVSSNKRLQKSIDRTEDFFKICVEKHKNSSNLSQSMMLAPIVGGFNKFSRLSSIKSIISNPNVSGYIFEGFHNYGKTAMTIDSESLISAISQSIEEVNDQKFRMIPGAFNPLVLLELVKLGVDCFDSSYVYVVGQYFRALTFNFELDNKKKPEFCINLQDEKYKDEFKPFIEDCLCLACQKHTRAYVNHLVKTKELLGPILLMIHNLHHYMKFFEAIRESIAQKKLDDLIELIKEQINDDTNSSSILDEKTDKIEKEKEEKTKKRI